MQDDKQITHVKYMQPVEFSAQDFCKAHFAIADVLKGKEFKLDDYILNIALKATELQLPVPISGLHYDDNNDGAYIAFGCCAGCRHPASKNEQRCGNCGKPFDHDHSYYKWQQKWYQENYKD